MQTTGTADSLVAALPAGVVITDPDLMDKYRHDLSGGAPAGQPIAVVRAENAEHVQACLRWASEHAVPVVPRGRGTGLAGGATAVDGSLVLSMERMTAVTIDPICNIATVEPGALNVDVKTAAAHHGLWYPPDPASFRISSIGGNVATNAGGLCCVKYGVTVDYVLGLDVVQADGTLLRLGGKTLKDVAGLPLVKLYVGSEGTLGVVTRVHLRLIPLPPPASTMTAFFSTLAAAGEAVVAIRRRLRPSTLELMDRALLNAVEDHRPMGLDRAAAALLIGQSDSPDHTRSEDAALMVRICQDAGATEALWTDDEHEGDMFLEARRMTGAAVEVRGAVLPEDIAVPIDRLPEMLQTIEAISREHRIEIPIAAHAGDGNLHPMIVYQAADADERARAHAAFDALMTAAIQCSGTITGEHGVGRAKRRALAQQLGPEVLAVNRRIKTALDPDNILNPGAML